MPPLDLLTPLSSVSLDESIAGYPFLRIRHAKASASIALHGAHLTDWTPAGEKPVIYTSPTAIYKEGRAIRGGVPICWPWFNAHPEDPTLPSHGVARNAFWDLIDASEAEEGVILTLSLPRTEALIGSFPPAFELTLTMRIGAKLTLTLLTKNSSDDTFRVGGALHTYFAISHLGKVQLNGLEGVTYIDTVGTEALKVQNGPITFTEETDRIFIETSDAVILQDSGWNRSVKVEKSGSASTVIWNPAAEKATALPDLPDHGYKDFVCIEAANARKDIYTLESGQSTSLEQRITVAPLQ